MAGSDWLVLLVQLTASLVLSVLLHCWHKAGCSVFDVQNWCPFTVLLSLASFSRLLSFSWGKPQQKWHRLLTSKAFKQPVTLLKSNSPHFCQTFVSALYCFKLTNLPQKHTHTWKCPCDILCCILKNYKNAMSFSVHKHPPNCCEVLLQQSSASHS